MVPPKTAFITHWFPKPSETFVFREVQGLWEQGLPLMVFSLYGRLGKGLSSEMTSFKMPVERLGIKYLAAVGREINRWRGLRPGMVPKIARTVLKRRWRDLEQTGENLWAFGAGFYLGRRCLEEGVRHIHAAWANGPATAAWTASLLSGIPFSFSARATDIFPPDGALAEKIRAAAFVRTESRATPGHLIRQAPDCAAKIHPVHAPLTLKIRDRAEVVLKPPYRFLAVGRLVRKKGFEFLLKACSILAARGVDFRLDLIGSGPCQRRLVSLTRKHGLGGRVLFRGFVEHDRISAYYAQADLLVMPCLVLPKGDRDGLPNVIIEALSHGLPVVATDVSGIREIIRTGETGVLVPRADPEELAGAIMRIIGNRERALEMAGAGRSLVEREFDPERNRQRMMELLREGAL